MTDEEAEESIMAVDNDGNGEVITFTLISYPMQGFNILSRENIEFRSYQYITFFRLTMKNSCIYSCQR